MNDVCPKCKKVVREVNVNVCKHCGADLLQKPQICAVEGVPIDLLEATLAKLRKSNGNRIATRVALIDYFREGLCNGFPSALLIKWILFWPRKGTSVFTRVGYSAQARKEFLQILKGLGPRDLFEESDPHDIHASQPPQLSTNISGLLTQARARIMWGEHAKDVLEFLLSNGISCELADSKLADFRNERNREVRRIGTWKAAEGGLIVFLVSALLYPCYKYFSPLSGTDEIRIILAFAAGAGYGTLKVVKGLLYSFFPTIVRESLSEI